MTGTHLQGSTSSDNKPAGWMATLVAKLLLNVRGPWYVSRAGFMRDATFSLMDPTPWTGQMTIRVENVTIQYEENDILASAHLSYVFPLVPARWSVRLLVSRSFW